MSKESKDGLPTGEDPGVPNDVFDPHPATEQGTDKNQHLGGRKPKASDVGANSYAHDGKSPPRPDGKGQRPP